MTSLFHRARVLVTGGTGLIGRPLVERLIERGASVRIASLDDPSRAHPQAEFLQVDLTAFDNCRRACEGMDYVFHLAGIKGSPAMARTKPASFLVPMLLLNTNVMEAARQRGVRGYLFTSSIGVYAPAEILLEDEVWSRLPSEHDRFPAWAKRMGELQAEAYRIEYGWDRVVIVRPANVYGPYDNFDATNAMVIPSLIRRVVDGEDPLVVWGDGSAVRDFIYAGDVADGMLLAMERGLGQVINLGSGTGVSIRQLVERLVGQADPRPTVVWDPSKPSGDARRVLDGARAQALGFRPAVSLEEGLRRTMAWYRAHRQGEGARYNVFTDAVLVR